MNVKPTYAIKKKRKTLFIHVCTTSLKVEGLLVVKGKFKNFCVIDGHVLIIDNYSFGFGFYSCNQGAIQCVPAWCAQYTVWSNQMHFGPVYQNDF